MIRRRLGAVGLVLVALCALIASRLLPPRAIAAEAPAERDARTLRVMTYNIHICQGMDKRFDPARIADVIKRNGVDVVALQEVDNKARRSGKVDQLAELAHLTGMHGAFCKARDYDGGEYGQAVLSRQPIESLEVHKLSGADAHLAPTDERIGWLAHIKQPRPLPELLLVGTHLHHVSDAFRVSEATELNRLLADAIDKRRPAVVLCGDFNATPDSAVIKMMREKWEDPTADAGMTFPSDEPVKKIDYVMLPKGHGWTIVSAKVIDEPMASDHRPVVVELRWKGE